MHSVIVSLQYLEIEVQPLFGCVSVWNKHTPDCIDVYSSDFGIHAQVKNEQSENELICFSSLGWSLILPKGLQKPGFEVLQPNVLADFYNLAKFLLAIQGNSFSPHPAH